MKKNIELFTDKKDCCACEACVNICPKGAITMDKDDAGFLYPSINHEKCISCGLCVKTCGYKKYENTKKSSSEKVYAMSSKNDELITKSASGAAFAEIAKYVLERNGVVYGATSESRDNNWAVHHIRIDGIDNLHLLQGSKYVQSRMADSYTKVKQDLNDGRFVLFSGTPCQIDGLNHYLGRDYENLLTVDIICHGVPSQQMYVDFLQMREKQIGAQIDRFVFRDKSKGQGMISRIDILNGTESKTIIKKGELYSYFYLFLKQRIYRLNCYSCPYAVRERVSDITLGDYWGFNDFYPNISPERGLTDKRGISCVIGNTNKGIDVLGKIVKYCNYIESDYEKASKYNGQLRHPSTLDSYRERIINIYSEKGYVGVEKFYLTHFWKDRIKYSISALLPMELKRQIRKRL